MICEKITYDDYEDFFRFMYKNVDIWSSDSYEDNPNILRHSFIDGWFILDIF